MAEAMTAGLLGCMTTPAQGNRVPELAVYACDNGKFGKGWPGPDAWFGWLARTVAKYGPDRCLWAAAPDVPFDAAGTLAESTPWLERIRSLGIPAAFCAQDGSENDLIPWGHLHPGDCLFLAGTTAWKVGYAAAEVADEASARGLNVHVGRVNSKKRLAHALAIGAATADGTYLAFGPSKNLARLLRFQAELAVEEPRGVQFDLLDAFAAMDRRGAR